MFNDSKYTRWYFSIIDNARLQNRIRNVGDYFEDHHIIPKSCGGGNGPRNMVRLTAREHYICHALLPKMCTDNSHKAKMTYAFMMLSEARNGKRCAYAYTGRQYERLKIAYIANISGPNNYMYGVPKSPEIRAKSSATKKAKGDSIGEKNGMYGKSHTSESIALMSQRKKEEIQKRGSLVHQQKQIDANPRSRRVQTNTGEIFPSISAACRAEGYKNSTMGRNRIKSGFWSYVD